MKKLKTKTQAELAFRRLLIFCGAILVTSTAYSNPVLNNISAGSVKIQQTPHSTVINQSSQKAIINWRNFNIGKQEFTHFQQPRGGVTLNRISPYDGVSQIYGKLTSTGRIILINPAGIYFGPSSFVNVGGLIATTADLSDQNFLKGNYQFTKVPGYSGAVVNDGQITAAKHGLVALVGPGVVNNGKIEANLGHVVLASGEAFTVNFSGDGMVNFAITGKTTRPGVDKDGRTLRDGVRNTGSLIANGGKVLVTASAAQGVLDNAINMEGVAQAKSVSTRNGEIIFSGDTDSGVVRVAAKVDVSGKAPGQKGGTVKITGNKILVESPTVIDASGYAGGGDIYIGGNYKGGGPLPNAKAVVIMPETMLLADAKTYGDGGNIIVWSDEVTKVYGKVSAKGGALKGDGGFIETSSHDYLDVAGIQVDTSAPHGTKGTWLLDPRNVFITTASTSGGSFSGGDPNIFTPASDDSIVSNTDIMNNLALTDVTITTGATGTQDGNISVNAPITWATSSALSLEAANKIFLNANITAPNGTLNLTAINTPQSITSGTAASPSTTGVTADINVANFRLLQGEWYQNNATLPTFNVTNNFNIAQGGTINGSFNATFTRMVGGNGAGSPYQITDKFGLEGIATLSLTNNYVLNNDIDLAGTSAWNDGAGFLPISPPSRNSNFAYQGTFDGQNHVLYNVTIDNPGNLTDTGLFVNLGPTSAIQNLGLINPTVTAFTPDDSSVGTLAGANSGTMTNVYALGGSVTSTSANTRLGGLVGINFGSGSISNAYSDVDVVYLPGSSNAGLDRSGAGGLVGMNIQSASINNAYSLGSVTLSPTGNNSSIGGFVGFNTDAGSINNGLSITEVDATSGSGNQIGGFIGLQVGTASISNSFWDTDVTGQAQGFGTNTSTISNLNGGCFSGTCTILPGANSSNPGAPVTLSNQTTYSNVGWDIQPAPNTGTTWNIVNGETYPFLSSLSSAIRGETGVSAVNTINLAINGINIQSLNTDATGTFYSTVPFNQLIIAYSPGSTGTIGNTIFNVSQGNDPNTQPTLIRSNQLLIDSSLTPSNTDLSQTIGGLSSGILFSAIGSDLILDNNISFVSNQSYTLDGDITTSGSGGMTFNDSVFMSDDAVLTTENGNINFNQGISGGQNLTLLSLGNANFNLTGPLSLHNVSVNGSTIGNNGLTLATSDNQIWHILSPNAGTVTGLSGITGIFSFNNIKNILGGSGNNQYIFSDQARLDGLLIGGTNPNAVHSLNYQGYTLPINVLLNSNTISGLVFVGDTQITTFQSINNLLANSLLSNTIILPNQTNLLTLTGPQQGLVNAPLSFLGFNTFISTSGTDSIRFLTPFNFNNSDSQFFINGSPLFFSNFNLDEFRTTTDTTEIASVMQQASINTSQPGTNETFSQVSQNINELMDELTKNYDANLDELKINPYCSGV